MLKDSMTRTETTSNRSFEERPLDRPHTQTSPQALFVDEKEFLCSFCGSSEESVYRYDRCARCGLSPFLNPKPKPSVCPRCGWLWKSEYVSGGCKECGRSDFPEKEFLCQ